jgi:hypothetical protein
MKRRKFAKQEKTLLLAERRQPGGKGYQLN